MIASSLLLSGVLTDRICATPIPQNLGNGLRDIVEKQSSTRQTTPGAQAAPSTANAAQRPSLINYDKLKITDAQQRVLVNIVLNGTLSHPIIQKRIADLGATITAVDAGYRAGVIEAFVSPAQAVEIAKMAGVSAVHLVPKPIKNIGKATTRGVVQHRIDKIPAGVNGAGVTVGVLSDSYDLASQFGAPVTAENDVASGDLPGAGNPFGHSKPVVVFQEGVSGSDEGRAMLQIVHDVAPEARLGFATAVVGEVEFANNIRSLAGLPSGSSSNSAFKADVIIDDVLYFDEPMFQDGIVAQAVDDVAAAGVAHFSSASNQPGLQAYDSAFRPVPASAKAGSNLDFTGVDPALYKGGFHNFATNGAQDIAQNIHIDQDGLIVFQWNEPYDSTPPALGKVLQSGSGSLTSENPTKTFAFAASAGQRIGITVDAAPGSANPLQDATITLIDPSGEEIAFRDATTIPELLIAFLPNSGTYEIRIGGFQGTTGDFVYDVRQASVKGSVESDFNLLFFDANGKFAGAVAEDNRSTNRPIEIGALFGAFDVQMVIARANKPAQGISAADHLRYVWFRGGQPQEYVSYTTAATYGHNSAAGANGVAAYAFSPPFIPESFTSPGPVTIYFDKDSNRLPEPELRQKPDMAAMDGANTTFFSQDAPQDHDGRPNFYGTSAAAPHAGGIAALVLQAAGGPRSLSPETVRRTMQASAFLHDLDPHHAAGVAEEAGNTVVISVDGDRNLASSTDPNFFGVVYRGPSSLKSLTFDLADANPTKRPTRQGLVFQPVEGLGFPFTLGDLVGVLPSAISTEFSMPAPGPSQFSQLKVSIKPGAMGNGDVIRFGVDRDETDAFGPLLAIGGNSADLFGSGILLPQGTIASGGAIFTATLSNGNVMEGVFTNTIGHGYSPVDGYGFVNAQKAIEAVTSNTPAQLLNVSTRAGVQTGDNVLIGGFIVTGESPKRVILRGIGPSLKTNGRGLPGRLADPMIELRDGNGVLLVSNDNWRDSSQSGAIESSGVAPSDDRESAILRTLDPGAYTVILRGKDDTTGIGLVEVYDGNPAAKSTLANVSTRGLVEAGDNAMIGGFMTGNSMTVVIRAIGPSLTGAGVADALQDPTLELHDANGTVFATNDNWRDDPSAAEIDANQLGPSDDRESATLQVLAPGAYTAVLRGNDDATGVALVEVYNVGNP